MIGSNSDSNYWVKKTIHELTFEEWENLCARCGKCCLVKLEDEGIIEFTSVCCRHLNLESCTCSQYAERNKVAPDCIILTPENISDLEWLPSTCSYRILITTQTLPNWHPLLSKNPESVHTAGMSIQHRAISEESITEDQLEDYCAPELG